MKLLYCRHCHDVIKLLSHERHCDCGACGGHYINDLDAVFWGDTAVPLGFDNPSFARALEAQPGGPGEGERFTAFVIPQVCPTMTKLDHRIKVREHVEPKRL